MSIKVLPDGWFTDNNISEYRRLASLIPKGGTLVEIGVWKGRSLCSVADIIKSRNIRVIAIDTFDGTETEGDAHVFAKTNDLFAVFSDNMKEFDLSPTIYKMTSHDASLVVNENIDLCFLDASHEYESVKQDIEDWQPKVKGTIAGHDYDEKWPGVIKAVNESFKAVISSDIWSKKIQNVLCYVSTCGRYDTTLPLTLVSIALQTRKPDHLIIFDDNKEKKDLRNIELYNYCFKLLMEKGVSWEVVFGEGKGQHFNHERANMMGYDLCWRTDDDEIPESNCLEELLKEMKEGVGAVGGLVLMPPAQQLPEYEATQDDPMLQWFHWDGPSRPQHKIYSSFLYRPGIVHYDLRLTQVAHREEDLFTRQLAAKGYKLIINPKAVTWHFRSKGGIRSGSETQAMFEHDDKILRDWMVQQKTEKKMFVFNGGIGDNYIALQALNIPPKSVVATCYPLVFRDADVELISIADAVKLCNIEDYNIYKWCCDHKWTGSIAAAYKELYKMGVDVEHKTILISPYSAQLRSGKVNPKNYPYFKMLVRLLKSEGWWVQQCGVKGEKEIEGADEFLVNLDFGKLKSYIKSARTWIAVDNFFPHLAQNVEKPGIVIFGQSDPLLFGEQSNYNLLKDRKYLRSNQFATWDEAEYKEDCFVSPVDIMKVVQNYDKKV